MLSNDGKTPKIIIAIISPNLSYKFHRWLLIFFPPAMQLPFWKQFPDVHLSLHQLPWNIEANSCSISQHTSMLPVARPFPVIQTFEIQVAVANMVFVDTSWHWSSDSLCSSYMWVCEPIVEASKWVRKYAWHTLLFLRIHAKEGVSIEMMENIQRYPNLKTFHIHQSITSYPSCLWATSLLQAVQKESTSGHLTRGLDPLTKAGTKWVGFVWGPQQVALQRKLRSKACRHL